MLNGRIGYLALVLLSPFIAINLIGGRRWWLSAMACFALIAILALSPAVQQRIVQAGKESIMYGVGSDKARDTSVGTRLALWKGAVSAFAEHPVVGVGVDGYPVIMRRLFPAWNASMSNPHNYYLYIAATYGLLGIVLYGWLWIVVFKRAWPRRDTWSGFMMLATLLVVSIGSLTETTPLQPQTGILLAMMVGLPFGDRLPCKS
jgi:O-antigen ligase